MNQVALQSWPRERFALVAHLAQTSGQAPDAVDAVLGALERSMVASLNRANGGIFTAPGLFHMTASRVPTFSIATVHPFTKAKGLFLVDSYKLELRAQWLDTFSCVGVRRLAPRRARGRRGAATGDS